MRKLVIILSVVLFTACSKNSDQLTTTEEEFASKAAQAPKVTKVFKGEFQSSIDTDPTIPPLPCTGDLPGLAAPSYLLHGNATHLGEVIWQQSRLDHSECNLSFATRQITTSVRGQLTASNGDIVYYTGSDVLDVTNLLTGNVSQPGTIEGTWTITGGTGRFAGATGSLTISGPVDFATLTFSFRAEGTITY